VLSRPFFRSADLPRSKDKIDPSPTGSATKPITKLGITPSVDIGEEQN